MANVNIFGQSIDSDDIIPTSCNVLPENISSEAEALILMAPPVQIFETDIFKINSGDVQQYKDTLLYKRYIDDPYVFNRNGYHSTIIKANAHIPSETGTGKLYIPFMRCMVYCEYLYIEYADGANENNWKNKIIFDAQGYQNQNIGRLNPSSPNIGNVATGFNKSPSEEIIMYTVNVPEKESIGKKTVYCWYYSPKTGLQIQYDPTCIFINDLRVVAF